MGESPPVTQETRVRVPGQEALLEKEAAAHSSVLPWKMPWTEEPGELQSMGSHVSDITWYIIYIHIYVNICFHHLNSEGNSVQQNHEIQACTMKV